jgi:diacylglycerol O-acyltransferase
MSNYQYERLSAQDNDFLLWETPSLPMHVAGVQIFDAGPLREEHGGIDFKAVKQLTESVLHLIPRYRQRLEWIPGEDRAVWVDDATFNLDYHFRHTSLPRPGTDEQLKRLMARLMEHPLDRSRPLWETWVVEGLEGDRFATLNKIHHCMIDGASGMNLIELLLSRTPEREIHDPPRFIPRPVPRPKDLRRDEQIRKLTTPLWAGRKLYEFVRDTEDVAGDVMAKAQSLVGLSRRKLFPVSSTPINGPVGPHRIVDWLAMPFSDVRAVKRALGCTVNDVVLATVTGAVRKLMQTRQVDPAKLDFRVSTPVNLKRDRASDETGNHVSSWIVQLPLGEADPLEQLNAIRKTTQELKDSDEAGVVKLVIEALDVLGLSVQDLSVGTMNMIVTNVPGPPFPLYLLGAQVRQMLPLAPLIDNMGISIGCLTYNGQLEWGFSADADRLPDLPDFRVAIERSFAQLAEAAGVELGKEPVLIPATAPTGIPETSAVHVESLKEVPPPKPVASKATGAPPRAH